MIVTILLLAIVDSGLADTIFLPLILESAESAAPYPTGALYVFSSVATTDGSGTRPGMNKICFSEDYQAHFCSFLEIGNAIQKEGVYFSDPLVESWVEIIENPAIPSTGGLGWYSDSYNCRGWTSNSINFHGGTIKDKAVLFTNDPTCNTIRSVLCCKWIP